MPQKKRLIIIAVLLLVLITQLWPRNSFPSAKLDEHFKARSGNVNCKALEAKCGAYEYVTAKGFPFVYLYKERGKIILTDISNLILNIAVVGGVVSTAGFMILRVSSNKKK